MADGRPVTEITFEAGYEQLKAIVARLDADDVSVHEMCELFARGKALEQALRGYLETQQGKLDEIEAGEHLPEFAIVAPGAPAAAAPPVGPPRVDVPDFGPVTPGRRSDRPADDEIPF